MGNAPSSNGLARQNMPNGGRDHHRLSGEYRQNMPHGSKANPAEPHAGMRARGQYAGGGAFEGARSPPNAAKSKFARVLNLVLARLTSALQCRYLACTLQVLQTRSMSGWEGLPVLALDRCIQVRAAM